MNEFIHIGPAGGYIGRISWSNSGYMDSRWGALIWRYCTTRDLPGQSLWWGSIWVLRVLMRSR